MKRMSLKDYERAKEYAHKKTQNSQQTKEWRKSLLTFLIATFEKQFKNIDNLDQKISEIHKVLLDIDKRIVAIEKQLKNEE